MSKEEELRTSSDTIHNMLYDSDMILGIKEWNALRIAEETMNEIAEDIRKEILKNKSYGTKKTK